MPDVCNELAGLLGISVFFVLKNFIKAGRSIMIPIEINTTPKIKKRVVSKSAIENGNWFCNKIEDKKINT